MYVMYDVVFYSIAPFHALCTSQEGFSGKWADYYIV